MSRRTMAGIDVVVVEAPGHRLRIGWQPAGPCHLVAASASAAPLVKMPSDGWERGTQGTHGMSGGVPGAVGGCVCNGL